MKEGETLRYVVRYIPLNKIRPENDYSKTTRRAKELKKVAQDAMHLLIVRKSKKAGGYTIVNGLQHFEYLKKHTNKKFAACLVDESRLSAGLGSVADLVDRMRKRKLPCDIPYTRTDRIAVNSWSIIRAFLKREPRFRKLSRRQQLKVLRLGIQYRKTTVQSMQAKVDDLLSSRRYYVQMTNDHTRKNATPKMQ
jgi:hypothetical protein